MSRVLNETLRQRNRLNARMVEHEGAQVALKEIAKRSGVCYHTLAKRYDRGLRGGELTKKPAPRNTSGQTVRVTKLQQQTYYLDQQRSTAAKFGAVEAANRAKAERERIARSQHGADFWRPLIDDSVLTDAERFEVHAKVTGSAQRQRWHGARGV